MSYVGEVILSLCDSSDVVYLGFCVIKMKCVFIVSWSDRWSKFWVSHFVVVFFLFIVWFGNDFIFVEFC